MKTSLTILAVLSLLATPVLANAATAVAAAPKAKATYCTDKVTHKRTSCKATPMAAAKPATAMAAKPAAAAKPAMAAKPAKPAKPATKMASAKPAAGHKGVKCGNAYIAVGKTCHK